MKKSKTDDEDYWNKSKLKAFNFDIEDEVSGAKDVPLSILV